jgi:hypothetical protein
MPLHLVVPGLLLAAERLRESARDLKLPGLATLLGRGERRPLASRSLADWIATAFGLPEGEAPWGALRLLGDGGDPGGDCWLCADPAHLRFARDMLVVVGSREIGLDMQESSRLVEMLDTELAATGRFSATAPDRWYLRALLAPDIRTQPLERVIGRPLDLYLPEGPDAKAWRAVLNEAQILLHNHAVNLEREAAGRPTANTIWLWGAGRLPSGLARPGGTLLAQDPLPRGAALAARMSVGDLPAGPGPAIASARSGSVIAVLDALREPALYLDVSAWRAALTELENRWFRPAMSALYSGQLRVLRLTALGDDAAFELALDVQDRWRFWRRPVELAELELPAAQP